MRPMVVIIFVCIVGFWGCDNELSYVSIDEYITTNQIENVKETASGLKYVIKNPSIGERPSKGQVVSVHYTGYHLDDSKFDSSYDRNQTFSFTLGARRVIAGWDEGIALFRKGAFGTLYIPYWLAYGESGSGSIAPREDLKFDIRLIEIK